MIGFRCLQKKNAPPVRRKYSYLQAGHSIQKYTRFQFVLTDTIPPLETFRPAEANSIIQYSPDSRLPLFSAALPWSRSAFHRRSKDPL